MHKVLVVDVAAEKGGALTVLNDYIEKFSRDTKAEYYFVLSNVYKEENGNIKFIQLPWVKNSYAHRLFFDLVFIYYLIHKYEIDEIYSLQNNAFICTSLPQTVLLHNALFFSERKYSYKQSKSIWLYQNIISRYVRFSLNYTKNVIVQANWIKKVLINKWGISEDSIVVDKPSFEVPDIIKPVCLPDGTSFFFPANGAVYKNHLYMMKAFKTINDFASLVLTGTFEDLNSECKRYIEQNNLNVFFLGNLNKDEMCYVYKNTVLVFPSLIETVGLPLLEAKALNSRILAIDLEYSKEALDNYDNVRYFSPYDIDELTRLMEIEISMQSSEVI